MFGNHNLWIVVCLFAVWTNVSVVGQVKQQPSPMVETTRQHRRLERTEVAGQRFDLQIGHLFIPASLADRENMPVFIHFHGSDWLPEVAAARLGRSAVITVQLGSGSRVYAQAFAASETLTNLLQQAQSTAAINFTQVGLTGWSAGYGAVREILRDETNFSRVNFVMLLDGLHAGYQSGQPGPLESSLKSQDLNVFVEFARAAAANRKQFVITHTEIFPGSFASTTETADFVLRQLGQKRTAVLAWGPMGTQQLSQVRVGGFLLQGFAGNAAPDHVDQLHALPEFLKLIRWQQ